MIRQILLINLGILFFFNILHAQTKHLSIGDKVPNISISQVLNYRSQNVKLEEFNKNGIIIDFFATWCTPCIAEMPRLDSLQKVFGDNLQIILVTYEDKDKVQQFMKTNKILSNVSFPILVGDTILRSLFPHKTVPHDVWINKGVVRAITEPKYITAKNISALLAEQLPPLPVKEDIEVDLEKSLFSLSTTSIAGARRTVEAPLYQVTLTGYIDGFSGGIGITSTKDGNVSRIYATNASILRLCQHALGVHFPVTNRIRLIDLESDKISHHGQDYDDWKLENTYTYELNIEPTTRERIGQLMLEDIRRYFGLIPSVETQFIDVYLLQVDSIKAKKSISKGDLEDTNLFTSDGKEKYMYNADFSLLVAALNRHSLIPVIDESGFTHKVDIRGLPADMGDIDAVNKSLARYGFSFVPAKREVELFVIREVEDNPISSAAR